MKDELVEAVAMKICRGGGYGHCVGFCHAQRCTDAIELYAPIARAIIPTVLERAAKVAWEYTNDASLTTAIRRLGD